LTVQVGGAIALSFRCLASLEEAKIFLAFGPV
jgi:hypothetical protein